MEKDPYAQNKAEMIAELLAANEVLVLSRPIEFKGGLDGVFHTVRMLQHHCGFPEKSYQIKFNGDVQALRLSDYFSRHVEEPGGYFWLLGKVILGGDMEEYRSIDTVRAWAQGNVPEPEEVEVTAFAYAIVKALKQKRKDAAGD